MAEICLLVATIELVLANLLRATECICKDHSILELTESGTFEALDDIAVHILEVGT